MNDAYYNGAGLNISQAVHSELRAHQVAYDGSDIERAAMSGAAARQGAIDEMQRLQDYQAGADAMRLLRESASRHAERLKQGLQAAPGTRESVLRADGQLDDSKMEELYLRAQDEVEKIKPKFWSPARQARYEQEFADWESENKTRVEGMVHQYRAAGIRRAGEAALEEAEAAGNLDWYRQELVNQVDAGLLMESEARTRYMRMEQKVERARLAAMRQAARSSKLAADDVTDELLNGMRASVPAEESAAGDDDGYKAHYVKDAKNYVPVLGVEASDTPVADAAEKVRNGQALTAVDPVADDKLETLELGLDVGRAASVTLGSGGGFSIELAEHPGEASVWQAARASQGGYTLAEHRLDVAHVAAAVLSDENYAGLTDKQRRDMIVQRVHLVGGAQLFFDGDEAAYEGWMMNQAEQLSGMNGVVKKTDRMLEGYAGAKGISALLAQEVTEQEVRDVWEDEWILNDESVKGIKAREALYLRYRDQWAAATGEEPKKDIIAAGNLKDFLEWYKQKGGLHDQRRNAFVKGVRDVYRQKAMDAVLRLRAERVAKLSDGTVVELDGESDWSVEQRVIRDTLGVPLTRADYGTLDALAHQEEVMADARRQRARMYAAKARESQEKVAGFNEAERKAGAAAFAAAAAADAAVAYDAAVRAEETKKKEAAAKVLNKQLGQGVPVAARWDGKKGAEPPKVVMPAAAYAAIADNLGAKDGLFVVLPGSSEPVPVEPDKDAKGVVFNKACIGMLKKGKFSKAELGKVVNGAAIKMKFTKDSVRYDF